MYMGSYTLISFNSLYNNFRQISTTTAITFNNETKITSTTSSGQQYIYLYKRAH
jgi:hypothetical protein